MSEETSEGGILGFLKKIGLPGPGLVLVGGAWKQDCSYPGNRVCAGVWTRQIKRYDRCMEDV